MEACECLAPRPDRISKKAESGRDLVHHPMHKELNSSPEKPDKILIYTAFPESNTIIKDVGGPFPITAHYAEADRTLTSTGRF